MIGQCPDDGALGVHSGWQVFIEGHFRTCKLYVYIYNIYRVLLCGVPFVISNTISAGRELLFGGRNAGE